MTELGDEACQLSRTADRLLTEPVIVLNQMVIDLNILPPVIPEYKEDPSSRGRGPPKISASITSTKHYHELDISLLLFSFYGEYSWLKTIGNHPSS